MDVFKTVLSPLGMNTNAIQDTIRWVVIGGTVETARRMSMSAWHELMRDLAFFLTAHFSQEDYPYDWLLHWLSKQPAWGQGREFEITTRSAGRQGMGQSNAGELEEDEEILDDEEQLVHGRRRRKVAFMPSFDTTHTIYYRGHWLRITRTKRTNEWGNCAELRVSVVARNNNILKKLVLEAKREYEKDAEHRVHIFMADSYGSWRWNGARQKRPMSSIVLEPGVKDMILNDCKDFLRSEDWYAERGIPFRRGYLLHGVPGSGKTSLIHSLAGELGLDIYVVSLSMKGMSDNTLSALMGHVPSRCILLLEDLDAAFTRSVSRDASSTGAPTTTTKSSSTSNSDNSDGSTLSLSGLLNSLDGVAAAEGRLLFATTNHIERLDPALSRPGRMDVWVNFTNASKWQAEGIFKCFFPSKASEKASTSSEQDPTAQRNMPGSKRKATKHVVPLLEEEEINMLAKRFADAIPEDELSVASLQGYLLKNKTRPRECVEEVADWIIKERELKAKLKKEKEAREAKEKKEAEEKALKEKKETADKEDEKEAKDKADRKEARAKAKKMRSDSTKLEPALIPAVAPAAISTSSADVSSSTSDSSSESLSSTSEDDETTGDDADTEESLTTDEEKEIEQAVDAATTSEPAPAETVGADKWVSVKGTAPPSSSSS